MKKLGLALGSGSARGWAHIGVINALNEEGIVADVVAGTSIGSVVGAVYSLGDMETFEKFVRGIDWKKVVSLMDITFPGTGLIPAKRLFKMLSSYYKDMRIEDLPIPFCAVATDVHTGDEIRFTSGRVMDAVRASIAIPGILTPHKYDGRVLVDGGVVNPVPVEAVTEMGAEVVIAVDLNKCKMEEVPRAELPAVEKTPEVQQSSDEERETRLLQVLEDKYEEFTGSIKTTIDSLWPRDPVPNILEILDNTINIMQKSITENQFKIARPDIVVEPDLCSFKLFDFDRADEAIAEGYDLMKAQIPELKKLLG